MQDEKGKVTGIDIVGPDGRRKVMAKAVILATGGFGASKEIIKKYRPDLEGYKTTNQAGATGDGLILGEEAGAELVQMDFIQVPPNRAN